METSNEKQAIRIADLGVEQLTFLQRQLDQEITFLTESLKVSFSKLLQLSNWPKYAIYRPNELLCNAFLNCALSEISGTLCEISKDYTVCAYFSQSVLQELKIFETKFNASEESVINSAKVAVDKEILVPLTESMYIPAKVVDPTKHLIEIGTGYFVEMNTEKAVDYFRRKQIYLKKQMEVIEGVLPEKYRARNAIVDNLQKKIHSFCSQVQRIDGRKCDEFREVKVVVGSELGSCLAVLGQTKVAVQVSCSLVEPSMARGNMGLVEVQVNMSPMACPEHEEGRLGSKGLELMRILELLFRDCGVIDLESLCLRAFKQVWQIRVDVHVLDADGSLVDCACIASLTALAHFRRPDVSVLPDSVVIHSNDEKIPIPLNIYHMPVCVTFGITPDGQNVVIDPTDKEEQCLKGSMIVAANKRHEICALHQSGNFSLTEHLIVRCVDLAIQRAIDVSELISSVVADDNIKRSKREQVSGYGELTSMNVLTSHYCEPNELIAPAVKTGIIQFYPDKQDFIINDNQVLLGNNEKVNMQRNEDIMLLEQVRTIASLKKADGSKKQQSDLEEVNELLEGIEEEFGCSNY